MMQTTCKRGGSIRRCWCAVSAALWMLVSAATLGAADRTSFLLPLGADAAGQEPPSGSYADALAGSSDGWKGYIRLWKAHHQDPADRSIRRFLGLPLHDAFEASARRGRTSPRWLGWRPGSFQQLETPHFVIYSRAAEKPSRRVAEDLERCYWVWTQMFFPLWEGAAQVSTALAPMDSNQSVVDYLKSKSSRITLRRKLQVVLFRNAQEYQRSLAPDVPGIERSTGYYNEAKQTTFLYADVDDDAAARRHEMVHQLFREATRSGLGRSSPGEASGFWLVEGIAGYFESLHLEDRFATVGGWDSPRLQFARYRVLVGSDAMPLMELMSDGRDRAQQRQDLARWYAHAISQTHQLLDGGDPQQRVWVYQQLARLYKIRVELPSAVNDKTVSMLDRTLRDFLSINDQVLVGNPSREGLRQLCLAGCEITEKGLLSIKPSAQMQWLDLSRLPIGNDSVRHLLPRPQTLEQLSLEATKIDGGLLEWLRYADNLREIDLSWTSMGDAAIESLRPATSLSTLWMTGSKVSDKSLDAIGAMRQLKSVDVQRTDVTPAGVQRLQAARPKLQINPLELRSP